MQRHGISRQVQQPSLGSTPHDRVTLLRICPSRSLALDRPQQNTARYPSVVTNRPTTCRLRHHPSLTHQPLYRRTPRCISSIQISQLARGTQIPIAPAAPLHVTLSAVSFLGGFRTPAAEHAAPSLKRPASETLPNNGSNQTSSRSHTLDNVRGRRQTKQHERHRVSRNTPLTKYQYLFLNLLHRPDWVLGLSAG